MCSFVCTSDIAWLGLLCTFFILNWLTKLSILFDIWNFPSKLLLTKGPMSFARFNFHFISYLRIGWMFFAHFATFIFTSNHDWQWVQCQLFTGLIRVALGISPLWCLITNVHFHFHYKLLLTKGSLLFAHFSISFWIMANKRFTVWHSFNI